MYFIKVDLTFLIAVHLMIALWAYACTVFSANDKIYNNYVDEVHKHNCKKENCSWKFPFLYNVNKKT